MSAHPHNKARDATAVVMYSWIILVAALIITIAECWQHHNRGRIPVNISSQTPLLPGKSSKKGGQNYWFRLWQKTRQQDLEQARLPSTSTQHGDAGYGTMELHDSSDEAQMSGQGSCSSSVPSLASTCSSSMLTSLTPLASSNAPRSVGPYSFSHTYDHIRTLAYCSEGPVHLVQHRLNGKRYVIKQVPANRDLPHEAVILSKIQPHPNIIEVADTLEGYTAERLTTDIVTPFAELGDLHNLIDHFLAINDYVPRAFILWFVSSMIDALAYLHNGDISYDPQTDTTTSIRHRQPSILHRDIKPLNIFITAASTTSGLPQIKLADFGLSCTTDTNIGVVGTDAYKAPEIIAIDHLCHAKHAYYIENYPRLPAICSPAGDMYAFGISLYQLIFLSAYSPEANIDREIRFTYLDDDVEIRDLLKACLARDPDARPAVGCLHGLSARIKLELEMWYAGGGRLPEKMWPDPMRSDREYERRGVRGVAGTAAASAASAAADGSASASASSGYAAASDFSLGDYLAGGAVDDSASHHRYSQASATATATATAMEQCAL